MVKVKIPEWFGTGDLRVSINGKTVAVPIGIETDVDEICADLIERLIKDRQKETLTREEILEKEREVIGAASAKDVEQLTMQVEEMKKRPQIKTLWTGSVTTESLTIEIPEECMTDNGKSLLIMMQNWQYREGGSQYNSNEPFVSCYKFGAEIEDDVGSNGTPGTMYYGVEYANQKNVNEEEVITREGHIFFRGDMYVKRKWVGGKPVVTLHYRNAQSKTVLTSIVALIPGE